MWDGTGSWNPFLWKKRTRYPAKSKQWLLMACRHMSLGISNQGIDLVLTATFSLQEGLKSTVTFGETYYKQRLRLIHSK